MIRNRKIKILFVVVLISFSLSLIQGRLNNNISSISTQAEITVDKLDNYNGTTSRELLEVITNIFLTSNTRATKELALDIINSIKK